MDTRVYEALLQACQELIKGPRQGVEGLDTAPHIRHLAQLAIGSASEGSRRAVADLDRRWQLTRSRASGHGESRMRSLASGYGATEREQR
jgi:hypothetical protein